MYKVILEFNDSEEIYILAKYLFKAYEAAENDEHKRIIAKHAFKIIDKTREITIQEVLGRQSEEEKNKH